MMGGAGGMGWMWLIWPVILIGIVLVVVLLLRGGGTNPNYDAGSTRAAQQTRARELLDERYARGEIGDEEYERMRENLRRGTEH